MQYNNLISELYTQYLKFGKVSTDTRKIEPGALFFALSGPNFDGNKFAAEALTHGASACVVDDQATSEKLKAEGHIVFLVEDTLKCLQDLAKHHREQFDFPVVAITGSNGKTTTKELVLSVLVQQMDVLGTEGNLNNHIGIPLTLLSWPNSLDVGIVEMGANHPGEIAGYCEIAQPDYGLITNCGKAHLEGFKSLEGVVEAKTELYRYIKQKGGKIFINEDLAYLQAPAQGIQVALSYGQTKGMIQGQVLESRPLAVKLIEPFEEMVLTKLFGAYNVDNILAAISVGLYFGVSWPQIKLALASYLPENQRSQWVETVNNHLVLDAYNANPTSMKAAIHNMTSYDNKNVALCLGGMHELGEVSHQEHEAIVEMIRAYEWKGVYLVGQYFEHWKEQYQWFNSVEELAAHFEQNPIKESTILIKGSRSTQMEKLVKVL